MFPNRQYEYIKPVNRVSSPQFIKQGGFGLPAAIFVITVLALVITTMARLQQSSADGSSLQLLSLRAFYAAESGIELALNVIIPPDGSAGRACATSPFYQQTFTVAGLNQCSAEVSCRELLIDGESQYVLLSRGQCGDGTLQAQRQIEVGVR